MTLAELLPSALLCCLELRHRLLAARRVAAICGALRETRGDRPEPRLALRRLRERQRTTIAFWLVQARHEDRHRDAAHARNHFEAAWRNAVGATISDIDNEINEYIGRVTNSAAPHVSRITDKQVETFLHLFPREAVMMLKTSWPSAGAKSTSFSFGRSIWSTCCKPARSGSSNRCAQRCVVCTCVWPKSLPIIGSDIPPETSSDANVCRRSWMRTSTMPASFRIRSQKRLMLAASLSIRFAPQPSASVKGEHR
jgi:hypothetical protein